MKLHCCELMKAQVDTPCPTHGLRQECSDALISYTEKFDEYGLLLHDGGSSSISISFCPWCGASLSASKRNEWFEQLSVLGFDDPTSQAIPDEFKTDTWYRAS